MNAHVLRKRSLAKNLIFILLPVLTLLVSWCQCFSAVTPSSVNPHNMLKDSISHTQLNYVQHQQHFADPAHETENNNVNFLNVPKPEISQKFKFNQIETTKPNTALIAPLNNNNMEMDTPLMYPQNIHNKPNTRGIMFHRTDVGSASDFITRGFLRKRNINASQKRLSMQFHHEKTQIKGDALQNNLHQRLRMLPKTINNISIRNNSHNYSRNINYNSFTHPNNKYKNEINAIERRNEAHNQYDYDAVRLSTSMIHNHSSQILNSQNESDKQRLRLHKLEHNQRNRRESITKLSTVNTLKRLSPFSYSRINGQSFGNVNAARPPRRFCTARDPTTLAFEAPTVFEGKVRSMSSDRRRNFSVTFEVKEIYKRQIGLKLPALVRLKFTYKNSSECDIYREQFRPIGHVRDELEPGKLYILFVNQIDLGNFTILGQPVRPTRKTIMDVRTGAAEKYGQRAYIESLVANNATIKEGKRLRIVCKVRGHPPPKVTWFKDNRSIAKNRSRYQFIHLRRRSELIIKSAFVNDSGQYECRAKNKLARQPIRKFTRIDVLPKAQEYTRHSFQQINWTHSGSACPVIGNAFCLNGGTCVFFKDVGEPACKCPDGFLGNRCETKNPTNIHSSTYRNNQEIRQQQHQCGENNFYGSYYC